MRSQVLSRFTFVSCVVRIIFRKSIAEILYFVVFVSGVLFDGMCLPLLSMGAGSPRGLFFRTLVRRPSDTLKTCLKNDLHTNVFHLPLVSDTIEETPWASM